MTPLLFSKTTLPVLLLGCLYFSIGSAAVDQESMVWLQKMVSASQKLNYEGRLVYVHDNELDVIEVVHGVDERGQHERLIHLNGTLREVVRTNDKVICILADNESISVENRIESRLSPTSILQGLQEAKHLYHFHVVGQERITNRMATRIEVGSKDDYRYGYRIWVDTEQGLLLKTELLDEQKRPIEQLMFTQLRVLDHFPSSKLTIKLPQSLLEKHQAPEQKVLLPAVKNWQVEWVPEGFKKVEHDRHILVQGGAPVEHIVYSDGLASVSVYIEKPLDEGSASQGDSRMGAMSMHRALLNGNQVTVLGEVPMSTVRRIAGSVVDYRGDS